MVSGDEATCREARSFFGNAPITVPVKKGLSREAALLYPFTETRQSLYEGAKRAMSVISSCKPYKLQIPIKIRMQYLSSDPAVSKPEVITKEGVAINALHILDAIK